MGFIDSYKRLEKLCGEVLNDDRRISAYIDEMVNNPRGSYYVRTWNDDLKKLKHYRWVRNKITHEPGYNEDNMCEPSDTCWLDDFYLRIMNQNDPLTLYRKATDRYTTYSSYNQQKPMNTKQTDYKSLPQGEIGCATIMMIAIVSIIVFALAMIGV
jgi:hypothetical protein